jgi:hypothetical protein
MPEVSRRAPLFCANIAPITFTGTCLLISVLALLCCLVYNHSLLGGPQQAYGTTQARVQWALAVAYSELCAIAEVGF